VARRRVNGRAAARCRARRLEDLRLTALEERIEHDPPSVAELEALVAGHPTRERLIGQLVRALYRAGRQAEALAAYRDARRRLVEEHGLEPSPELRELERRVLQQDPTLLQSVAARGRSRRQWLVPIVVVLVAVTAATFALVLGRPRAHAPIAVQPNTVIGIDPRTNRVVASFPVGRAPSGIDVTADAIWVSSETERKVARIDLQTHAVETIGMPHPVAFLTHDDEGNVYASGWDFPLVWEIDPNRVEIVHTWRVRTRALGLAVGGGSLWVVDRLANAVSRIDLARGRVEPAISVGADPLVLAFGFGAVWVANSDDGTISVIRPGVPVPATIRGVDRAFGIAAGGGAVWVTSNAWSRLYKIDPDTRKIVAVINVSSLNLANDVFDVAAGAGGVWIANRGAPELVHVDPTMDRVVGRIEFPAGTEPHGIAVTPTMVWVSVANPADDT
jgi:DNA-binding beta-propeller fold protein YncE